MSGEANFIDHGSWIWKKDSFPDQYVCFRRTFALDKSIDDVIFGVSLDSDYVAYLDGMEIARGQYGDFASSKTGEPR